MVVSSDVILPVKYVSG